MGEASGPVWSTPHPGPTGPIPFFSSPLSFCPLCWGEGLKVAIASLIFKGYPVTQRPLLSWVGDSVPELSVIGYRKPDPGNGM